MSQKRPWQTALSSLVVTLTDDALVATETIEKITAHESIITDAPIRNYLPIVIESADARPIHQWLESLPGVRYVDVTFCSIDQPNEVAP